MHFKEDNLLLVIIIKTDLWLVDKWQVIQKSINMMINNLKFNLHKY